MVVFLGSIIVSTFSVPTVRASPDWLTGISIECSSTKRNTDGATASIRVNVTFFGQTIGSTPVPLTCTAGHKVFVDVRSTGPNKPTDWEYKGWLYNTVAKNNVTIMGSGTKFPDHMTNDMNGLASSTFAVDKPRVP